MAKKKLTEGQLFTLRQLTTFPRTGTSIAMLAMKEGINKRPHGANEWADHHLRYLRSVGLVELTGTHELGARLHRITDAGRAALAEAEK